MNAKFGVNKPVIIIDSCEVKSWFNMANLRCISQSAKAKKLYFILYCVFEIILILND